MQVSHGSRYREEVRETDRGQTTIYLLMELKEKMRVWGK